MVTFELCNCNDVIHGYFISDGETLPIPVVSKAAVARLAEIYNDFGGKENALKLVETAGLPDSIPGDIAMVEDLAYVDTVLRLGIVAEAIMR